jgi:hypothetical protein
MLKLTYAGSNFALIAAVVVIFFVAMAIAPCSALVSKQMPSLREEPRATVVAQARSGVGESITLYDEKGAKETKRTDFSFVEPSLVKHILRFSTGKTQNKTCVRHPSQWVFFSIEPDALAVSRESWTNITCLPSTTYKMEWTSNDVLLNGPFSILHLEDFEGDLKWNAEGTVRADLNDSIVFRGEKSLEVHDSSWGIVKRTDLNIPVSKESFILFGVFLEEPAQTFFEVRFELANGEILALQYLFFSAAYPSWPNVPNLAIYRTMMNYSVGCWNTINMSIGENLRSLEIYDKVDISKILEFRITNNLATAFFDNIAVVDRNIEVNLGEMEELSGKSALKSFTISGQLNEISPYYASPFNSEVDTQLLDLRTNSSIRTSVATINGSFSNKVVGPHFAGNYSLHLSYRGNDNLQIPLSIVSLSVYGIGIQSSFSNLHMIQDVYTVPSHYTVYFDFYVFAGNSLFNESSFALFVNEVSTEVVISENGHVETSLFCDKEGVYNIDFLPQAVCKEEITLPLIHSLHATIFVRAAENQSYYSTIAFLLFAFFSSVALSHFVSRMTKRKLGFLNLIIFGLALWFSLGIVVLYIAGIAYGHLRLVGYVIVGLGFSLIAAGTLEMSISKLRHRIPSGQGVSAFRRIVNFLRLHKNALLAIALITPFIFINFYLSSIQTPQDWDAVDIFVPYTQLFLKYDRILNYSFEISKWTAESPGISLIYFLSAVFLQSTSLLYINGISVLFHIGLILVTYKMGKLLHSNTVGLVSALLTAGFPVFMRYFYRLPNYNDMPGAFFVSVVFYILFRFFVSPLKSVSLNRREVFLWTSATFLITFAAFLTKIIAVVLVPVMLFILVERFFTRKIRILFVSIYYAGCFLFLSFFLSRTNIILDSLTLTLVWGFGFLIVAALVSLKYAFHNGAETSQNENLHHQMSRTFLGSLFIAIVFGVGLGAFVYFFRNYLMVGNLLYPYVKPAYMLWAQQLLQRASLESGRIESVSVGAIVFLLPGYGVLFNAFKVVGGSKMTQERRKPYRICLPLFLMIHSFLFIIAGSVSPRHAFFEVSFLTIMTAVGIVTFLEKLRLTRELSAGEITTTALSLASILLLLCYLLGEATLVSWPDSGMWMIDSLLFFVIGTVISFTFVVLVFLLSQIRFLDNLPKLLSAGINHKALNLRALFILLFIVIVLNAVFGLTLGIGSVNDSILVENNVRANHFMSLREYLTPNSRILSLTGVPGSYLSLGDIQDINIVYVESLYRMEDLFLARNISDAVSSLKREADYVLVPTSQEWTWNWWLNFVRDAPYLRLCRNPQMTQYVGNIDRAQLYRINKEFAFNSSENPVLDLAFSSEESILGRQILLESHMAVESSELRFDLALVNPKVDNETARVKVEVDWSMQLFNDQSEILTNKNESSEFLCVSNQEYQDVSFYNFVLLDAKELKIQRSDAAYARAEIYRISLLITQHESTTSVSLVPYKNLPLVLENQNLGNNWYMLPCSGLFTFEG